jgi:hypothetical protein
MINVRSIPTVIGSAANEVSLGEIMRVASEIAI